MVDKKRLAELDKAITEKRAELKQVQQEKRAAAQDPERFVLAEKAERRISGQLQGLEAARAAAAYTPPALSPSRKNGQENGRKSGVKEYQNQAAEEKRYASKRSGESQPRAEWGRREL